MRAIARIANLVRGLITNWIRGREHRHPDAVYEAAIQQRQQQYARLRQAAAGVLYMQGKLAREVERHSAEQAHIRRQLEIAIAQDDDEAAVTLITRQNTIQSEVERLNTDLRDLTTEAEAAKENLIAFQSEIARLREERTRMLARLANAKARLRLHETLNGLSPDADIRALEDIRDHINRLVTETQLTSDLNDTDLTRRLTQIRQTESESTARAQLEELKRARLSLPAPAA
jgi:phage shock protein A